MSTQPQDGFDPSAIDIDPHDDQHGNAPAVLVNRTHRVVRERARALHARKSKARSLWIPLAVSAGLLGAVVVAIWTMLEEYDLSTTGMPESSQQIFVLLMWCVPISLAALAVVLFRRAGARADHERAQ